MADLVAAADLRVLGEAYTEKYLLDTVAAHVIYKGTPMIVDQDVDATGKLVPFISTVVVAATDVFMGIAAENKSVTIGALENTYIECYVYPTILGFKSAVFTAGVDNGVAVYADDSGLLVGVAGIGAHPYLGKVFKVEGGYCYVSLSAPYICVGA